MKTSFLFLTLLITGQVLAAATVVKGIYNIDPDHTRVSFTIPHFVISQVEGRFDEVKGTFTLTEPFENSKAIVTVPIKSIDTGVAKRDEDLRSKNFFDEKKYPTMTFVTKAFAGTPESFTATGALTIKDVTKDVTFNGQYTGSLKDPWGKQRSTILLTGKINRRDFHIEHSEKTELGPAIGDEVTIRIQTDGILTK